MAAKRVVVIGASSGGIEALRTILGRLPLDFGAPICVVVHTSPEAPGVLHTILDRAGPLPAVAAATGDRLEDGRIYVAPPDYHLLVEPGELCLSRGPRENRFRPAIDPLFRSAAQVYGPGAIGVILSGNLDDGVAGLQVITQLGGLAVVQDPADALFPSMPQTALEHVRVSHVAPATELAGLLTELVTAPVTAPPAPVPHDVEVEVKIAKERNAVDVGLKEIGEPSSFACPECHGVLLRLREAVPLRFRCHTGHAFTADSLLAAVNAAIEDAIWNAARALEEGRLLLEHLAAHAAERGDAAAAARLDKQIAGARRAATAVREAAVERVSLVAPTGAATPHD